MILTLKQYNELQVHQKAVVVCSESTLIDMELKKNIIYTLYSYCGYYIEVRVNNITNELIDITAFRNGRKLDKYLSKLDLPEMINK